VARPLRHHLSPIAGGAQPRASVDVVKRQGRRVDGPLDFGELNSNSDVNHVFFIDMA
jgi:hypothetical protein